MNTVITFFQDLASQVPEFLQPVIIALAGAVPFVEGEVSAAIGVWAGLNPFVAGLAGAIGNFLCVAVIVVLGARARAAMVARRQQNRTRDAALAAIGAPGRESSGAPGQEASGAGQTLVSDESSDSAAVADSQKPQSKGRARFLRLLNRFGVPGASLLGPAAIPTQITTTILVGAGVKPSWILLWQGIAIVAWTTLITAFAVGALTLVTG
ncbi:hypothetical protein SAMN04489751_1587 [Brevibacterium sandarakinum]|uniref:Small multidrug efflux protein n=1 Tax=Brevibacterium sandarakinum TaxID=629680 RepID=A0A1H1QQY4_BRESA|nr:small multidrug efflux protein [Brevibacterium sandarakinum]SDS25309.1 hypothetical protein SAMN04489751_1587 [Brevibacterium sandarakinum]